MQMWLPSLGSEYLHAFGSSLRCHSHNAETRQGAGKLTGNIYELERTNLKYTDLFKSTHPPFLHYVHAHGLLMENYALNLQSNIDKLLIF